MRPLATIGLPIALSGSARACPVRDRTPYGDITSPNGDDTYRFLTREERREWRVRDRLVRAAAEKRAAEMHAERLSKAASELPTIRSSQ